MITIGGHEINLLAVGLIGAIILTFVQYKLLRSKQKMAVKLIPVYIVALGFACCGLLALGVFGDFTAQGYAGNVNGILAKGFAITFAIMCIGLVMGKMMAKIKNAMDSVDNEKVLAMVQSKNNKTIAEYNEEYGEDYDEDEEYDYDDDEEYEYEDDEEYEEYDDDSEYDYDEDEEYIDQENEESEEDPEEENADK